MQIEPIFTNINENKFLFNDIDKFEYFINNVFKFSEISCLIYLNINNAYST